MTLPSISELVEPPFTTPITANAGDTSNKKGVTMTYADYQVLALLCVCFAALSFVWAAIEEIFK